MSPLKRAPLGFLVLAVTLAVLACAPAGDDSAILLELAAARGSRLSPGRLWGQREHSPHVTAPGPRSAIADRAAARRWRDTARRIRRRAAERRTAETVAELGILELLSGDLEAAVDHLEWAAAAAPGPRVESDLAAAYLARAAAGGAFDWVRALERADRAVESDPTRPEAVFNRATALSGLHLPRSAAAAWERFLAIEPRGPWAEEGRRQVSVLNDSSEAAEWSAIRRELVAGEEASEAVIRRAAVRYPFETRTTIERELLPSWAHGVLAGDFEAAEPWLTRAGVMADLLEQLHGDRLMADEVAVARASTVDEGSEPSALRRHALSLRRYLDGLVHYDEQRFATASAILEKAGASLRAEGSPLALRAELIVAICRYYEEVPQAEAELDDLLARLPAEYPATRGEALWMRGIVAAGQRRFEEAVGFYRAALPLVESSEGATRAASLHLVLAETFDHRGEWARGWSHRHTALSELSYRGTPRRKYGVALEAAQALTRHGRVRLALLFLAEAASRTEEYGALSAGAEIHIERARLHLLERRPETARRELERAGGFVGRIEESGLRERLAATVALTEEMVLAAEDPAAAVGRLQAAHASQEASGYRLDELDYLVRLADARKRSGDFDGARTTLESAVELYERTRSEARELVSSVESFRRAEAIFNELISLSLDAPGADDSETFRWAERGRARLLLDLWPREAQEEDGVATPVDVHDVVNRMPPETLLVEYAVLDDRVFCWLVDRHGIRLQRLGVSPAELERQVEAFSTELEGQVSVTTLRRRGRRLFEQLIAPLGLDGRSPQRLVIVPDGPLQRLPFAALVDPATGRYLIESAALSVAPSATLYVLAEERRSRLGGPLRPLVVGSGAPSTGPYGYLPRLPSVEGEAEAVAARFPGASKLIGEQATPARVAELLPGVNGLHYSGHALSSRVEIGDSALVLVPEGEADDGLLRVPELARIPLEGLRLVTLSACRTLAGYEGGRDGAIGVAWTFFSSGTPSVVGSYWYVDDGASAALMEAFYEEYTPGGTAAEALRAAILRALSSDDPRTRSPALWATFAAIGV